ncbi:hypothetical protein XENTR_v10019782 [Xenopus tropicalis]|uniref:Uncharacterized protein LOC100495848 isoform X2 n=1 Tax=Xenopus tropicalis TaxID=8364 RepID=A0A8J0QQ86_XENTR|nr:uncharacterized protein LOC100495848 isoform X2 [Xenopus tropicalis]XP_031761360.1 uncharacterized protein LOC100495848 isoform X2 [Xenopus tropicalis]KAE8594745.1 hypothetical protein XENTR_v10019782 [Xenopus tropicalis]|eukprot:XP_002934753.1 PREDICTED: uncharacterized protein LOC100495848 [Xenopus tropicalis]
MCLKYSLQQEEPRLCDCAIRRQDLAMASIHHTFIINCHTGTRVCLTGDPRPIPLSSRTPPGRAPSTRERLRTCFTHCINNQSTTDQSRPHSGTSPKVKDCGKPVAPNSKRRPSLQPTDGKHDGGRICLYKALQDSVKQLLRSVASCLRTQKP